MALGVYNNQANLPDQPLLRGRAFALSLFNSSLDGALCWWSINYWGPGWCGQTFTASFFECCFPYVCPEPVLAK